MTGHDAHEWVGLTIDEIWDNVWRKLSEPGTEWLRFESVMVHPLTDEDKAECRSPKATVTFAGMPCSEGVPIGTDGDVFEYVDGDAK